MFISDIEIFILDILIYFKFISFTIQMFLLININRSYINLIFYNIVFFSMHMKIFKSTKINFNFFTYILFF